MTLKEKLQEEKLYINPHSFKLTKEGAESFEKIADDYAIEFYLWMKDNEERIKNGKIITDKDLLKEFKKEKGL
jgi:hypothetical protein